MSSINLKNVYLSYPLNLRNQVSFRKFFFTFFRNQTNHNNTLTHINALNDINISLSSGDKLGILGENGAGKTSLLKLIAGIYSPTLGYISTEGRISSLLDIFFGINPDATGKENIYIRGIYFGLSLNEIDNIMTKIVDFIDIGDFIHLPMKIYSTGMKMRLAFAVSIFFPSDILLMDEWLSVGDKNFVAKAEEALIKKVSSMAIVVYASHSEDQVNKICNKILFLEKGKIKNYYET